MNNKEANKNLGVCPVKRIISDVYSNIKNPIHFPNLPLGIDNT
jgi:hypothetical protein